MCTTKGEKWCHLLVTGWIISSKLSQEATISLTWKIYEKFICQEKKNQTGGHQGCQHCVFARFRSEEQARNS